MPLERMYHVLVPAVGPFLDEDGDHGEAGKRSHAEHNFADALRTMLSSDGGRPQATGASKHGDAPAGQAVVPQDGGLPASGVTLRRLAR